MNQTKTWSSGNGTNDSKNNSGNGNQDSLLTEGRTGGGKMYRHNTGVQNPEIKHR